ncbi:MAG: hypothetical protein RQ833_12190 [Sphingomonadaceae bacterium]|nr:hypothetical protein [Sphingomonadaceae bacterium]
MRKTTPASRPLIGGGESGGGAYSPDLHDEAAEHRDYSGGQSIKNYYSSATGGDTSEATVPVSDDTSKKDETNGG